MTTTTNQDHRLWILGLRDGWLYLRGSMQWLRLSPWPTVNLEIRTAAGTWTPASDEFATDILPRVEVELSDFTYDGKDQWRDSDGQHVASYALDSYDRASAWKNTLVARYLGNTPLAAPHGATEPAHLGFPSLGLIYLLARVPEVADFLAHDSNLALVLANHRRDWPVLREASWEEIRQRARGRRTALLGWLGLPGLDAARALLRKISPVELDLLPAAAPALGDLRILLTLLNSHERITPQLALLGCAPLRALVSPPTLQQLQRNVWFWEMLRYQWRPLRTLAERGVLRFQNSRDLVSLIEGGRSAQRTFSKTVVNAPFPEPPFITGPEVQPIRSVHGLIREGHEMNHCVGSLGYIAEVLAGKSHFYRVFHPVRATLQVSWRHGAWWFEALLGFGNEELSQREIQSALRSFPASSRIEGLACCE
jgi:hypothetical protein